MKLPKTEIMLMAAAAVTLAGGEAGADGLLWRLAGGVVPGDLADEEDLVVHGDERAAAVLLRGEAAGQQVGRLLALGPGQAQVVAGRGADAPPQQVDGDGQEEPDRDDDDGAPDA
jgi:hypothetical protein